MYFYDGGMLDCPEFKINNHLIRLKETDVEVMIENLKEREDAAKVVEAAKVVTA